MRGVTEEPERRRGGATTLTLALIGVALGVMVGLTSYSVTLYRLFCQVTGAGGQTARAGAPSAVQEARQVTVFFDTSVAPGMPWRFAPVQRRVTLRLGQTALVFFVAENLSDRPIVGHATFNVTPERAGPFFRKIQCFCFQEERLEPHARVEMPVSFFVDPRIADDPNTADVDQITLSYTFFPSRRPDGAAPLARLAADAGRQVFAARCAGCHALSGTVAGPPLAGVVGRRAGSVPGYPYSAALRGSGVTWDAAALDRWLADPQAMVPGAQMPARLPDAREREAVIGFLSESGGRS
jgi:cytochrome c oxidase assembly protein subunit 11